MTTKRAKLIVFVGCAVIVLVILANYLSGHSIPVLQAAGPVARKERQLMYISLGLAVFVVVPVYVMTIAIARNYHEKNKSKEYLPDWDHSIFYESIWWGIPLIIITILSVITWNSSHNLDPYRSIASTSNKINVQVVALDWKWLFIYPDFHVASVNQMALPMNYDANLSITSDTVMNSFWVPALSGQIYAMPGMETRLHLLADKTGTYQGSSANISGPGFASMTFEADAMTKSDFNKWLGDARASTRALDQTSYDQLAQPSKGAPISYYSNTPNDLFVNIILKYMNPTTQANNVVNVNNNYMRMGMMQ